MLYTIYPAEVIFQAREEPHYFTVNLGPRTFVLEMTDGQARLVRLISSDPTDYLDPRWQPGTTVGFTIPGTGT
ncbi:MAG: YlzJ-like family protein [Firmicutes bacterium]|nr:YlzJ-like family protein [Candidatus Fermentithermobacillaceae bacterium]